MLERTLKLTINDKVYGIYLIKVFDNAPISELLWQGEANAANFPAVGEVLVGGVEGQEEEEQGEEAEEEEMEVGVEEEKKLGEGVGKVCNLAGEIVPGSQHCQKLADKYS